MAFHLTFTNVSFTYQGAASDLFSGLNLDFPRGWTGIVGANGSGKSTLLFLAAGMLKPDQGAIQGRQGIVYCPQRTDEPPGNLEAFLTSDDPEAYRIAALLEVGSDWKETWQQRSHGERKRAQIAVSLWENPDILAIDEPTNHIDREARDLLASALAQYQGIGLLVSHDRHLLDSLVMQCLFLDPPRADMRAGTYTDAHAELENEHRALRQQSEELDRRKQKVRAEMNQRRQEASRSHSIRSKKNLARKDYDARFKKNAARVSGKDGKAGQLLKQMEGRFNHIEAKRDALKVKREQDLGIWIPSDAARKRILMEVPSMNIDLDEGRILQTPDLRVERDSHIALTGPNGSGKTTLIRRLLQENTLPDERVLYLPQEISAKQSAAILREVKNVRSTELGRLMQIVSRLGARPERVLESELPSPGEVRKLLIALGIQKNPHWIIMDEPTNHLDLPSIECLQKALRDCPCALLMVSHDQPFLEALTATEWTIQSRDQPVLEVR